MGLTLQSAKGGIAGSTGATDNALLRADGTGGATVQSSAITVDDAGAITLPNTGLHLLDTDASHDLIVAPGSNLTADRTLTVTTGDADRTLDISGGSITLAAGAYTPTLYNTTNVAGSTAYECQYLRVGNVCTVSGKFDIDPTALAETLLGMSLPISSNIGGNEDCGGTAAGIDIGQQEAWGVIGDATNDRVSFKTLSAVAGNHGVHLSFTYQII